MGQSSHENNPPHLLSYLAISSAALAFDPPPDGGCANQNTAEGEDALLSLSSGTDNTAIDFHALFGDTTGSLTQRWAARLCRSG